MISLEADYDTLWARRERFIASCGQPLRLVDHVDFEGLGFDLVEFELADGVEGELAFAHVGNVLAMHGGAYEVLVDRDGVLDGVAFPLS